MKKLNLEQMEMVEGGGWADCAFAGLGVVFLVGAISAAPVTGGLSLGIVASVFGQSVTLGYTAAGCLSTFI